MNRFDRITLTPGLMDGQPCIRGMRLTVRRVREALTVYPDWNELRQEYPELEEDDIRQALEFAALSWTTRSLPWKPLDTIAVGSGNVTVSQELSLRGALLRRSNLALLVQKPDCFVAKNAPRNDMLLERSDPAYRSSVSKVIVNNDNVVGFEAARSLAGEILKFTNLASRKSRIE